MRFLTEYQFSHQMTSLGSRDPYPLLTFRLFFTWYIRDMWKHVYGLRVAPARNTGRCMKIVTRLGTVKDMVPTVPVCMLGGMFSSHEALSVLTEEIL